ncbi:MAG: PRC-barrel domain-containing protein [Chloroflexota bacterium]
MVASLLLLIASMFAACGAQPTAPSLPAANPTMPDAGTLGSTPALTQNPATGTEEAGIIPLTGDPNPARLSNLLHFPLLNQAGEQLGQVSDIVMDLEASSIAYVIVASGGFFNLTGKQVAVPWSVLQVQFNADAAGPGFFTLAVDQNLFVNAPGIDLADALPDMGEAAEDWDQEIRAYWGMGTEPAEQSSSDLAPSTPGQFPGTLQPTPEGMPLEGIILASEALGFDFKLQGEEALNVSIDDMIINLQSGKILYVVIHTNFENAGDQWVPIPYSLLQWDPASRAYILNADMVTLQSAPFYIDSLYPDTTRPGWDDTCVFFWKEHGLIEQP